MWCYRLEINDFMLEMQWLISKNLNRRKKDNLLHYRWNELNWVYYLYSPSILVKCFYIIMCSYFNTAAVIWTRTTVLWKSTEFKIQLGKWIFLSGEGDYLENKLFLLPSHLHVCTIICFVSHLRRNNINRYKLNFLKYSKSFIIPYYYSILKICITIINQ